MFLSTQGIALGHFAYGDNASIVRILTCSIGIESYWIRGLSRSNKKNWSIFFRPLSLLDLEINYREYANFQRIREVKFSQLPHRLFEPQNLAYVWFLTDFLEHLLGKGGKGKDEHLFEFIFEFLSLINRASTGLGFLCLRFLLLLTEKMGIGWIHGEASEWKDLPFFSPQLLNFLRACQENSSNNSSDTHLLKEGIRFMIAYYQKFLYPFKLKSLDILSELGK
ncbi:MAG: recombination protein O N-terminal domain-containing protein [Cytophagales bacterium]|nr:recombination protein O N-terminal domain-containing protein [Cytophagales bacterium]